jgi:putative transcriptional regulator
MDGKLKDLRESKGLSQAELARRLDVSRFHINKIESGKVKPSLALLERIAVFFDISVKDLF